LPVAECQWAMLTIGCPVRVSKPLVLTYLAMLPVQRGSRFLSLHLLRFQLQSWD